MCDIPIDKQIVTLCGEVRQDVSPTLDLLDFFVWLRFMRQKLQHYGFTSFP